MKKELLFSATLLLAAGGLAACTTSSTDLPPGEYEKSTTKTDASGTTYKTKTTTDVEYDENGRKKATVESKTSKDPKGLFNKSTSTSKTTVKE